MNPASAAYRWNILLLLVSLQNFGGNVGGSFAPLVTGMLISPSGDFTVPLLVAAGVALVFGCGSYGLLVGNLDRELGTRESNVVADLQRLAD